MSNSVPSSTTKRLLPAFDSHSTGNDNDGIDIDDRTKDSSLSTDRGSINGESSSFLSNATSPHPTKRIKSSDSVSEPKEALRLPHETPIGKYLSSRMPTPKVISQDDRDGAVIVTPKRHNCLGWDDYFLGIAILSSKRSKDPDHAEGACIVDTQNRIVAIGYSGFPKGCPDTIFPWIDYSKSKETEAADSNADELQWLHSKQPYVCPAITNAVLNKCSQDVAGCRLYVMEFPSSDCVKVMIQSGIQELVIWKSSKRFNDSNSQSSSSSSSSSSALDVILSDDEQASRIMLEMANIQVRYHESAVSSLVLDFGIDEAQSHCNTTCCSNSTTPSNPSLSTNSYTTEEHNALQILKEEADYDATTVDDNGRRHDFLTWDDYFMSVAFLTAQRSKDPNTQVGACIVDDEHRIIGLGYNGMPRGLSDDAMPWARDSSNPPLFNKYLYVTHAEVNAILNKGSANVKGSTIYVALFPCENCAKMIIQSGIRRVIYLSDRYHSTDGCRASRIMFKCAGVELVQYTPSQNKLTVSYNNNGNGKL